MTVFPALAVLATSAIAFVAIAILHIHARRDLFRLHEYEHLSNKFFEAVDTLVNEPDTPAVVIDTLELLNKLMTDERAARNFFERYCALAYKNIEAGEIRKAPAEYITFIKAHPNLNEVSQDAFMGGLVALTYLSNRWGQKYRAMLADLYARDRRPTVVIDAFRESRNSRLLPAAA